MKNLNIINESSVFFEYTLHRVFNPVSFTADFIIPYVFRNFHEAPKQNILLLDCFPALQLHFNIYFPNLKVPVTLNQNLPR